MSALFDLTGQVALLTGASKGMGLSMATALAEHGSALDGGLAHLRLLGVLLLGLVADAVGVPVVDGVKPARQLDHRVGAGEPDLTFLELPKLRKVLEQHLFRVEARLCQVVVLLRVVLVVKASSSPAQHVGDAV